MKTKKFFRIMALTAVLAMFTVLSLAGCGSDSTPPEVAVYSSIDLYANRWDAFVTDDGYRVDAGSEWVSYETGIELTDFTTVKPKKGDVFKIKVSGISNKALDNFHFSFYGRNKVFAGSQRIDLPEVFSDYIFEFDCGEMDSIGDNSFDITCDVPVPAGTPNGTVMATISNFSISLVEDGIPSKSRFGDFEYERGRDIKYDDSIKQEDYPNLNDYWNARERTGEEIEYISITKYLGAGGNVTIPGEIKGKPVRIGSNAFKNCTGLTGVTIPGSVTYIGEYAFRGCTSLVSVTFQGTLSRTYGNYGGSGIGGYAFPGDLIKKFYETEGGGWSENNSGTPGTYTRTKGEDEWTRSP